MKYVLLLLFTLLTLGACTQDRVKTSKTIITGKVNDFEKCSKHNEISFTFYELLGDDGKTYSAKIDTTGNFCVEIKLSSLTEFILKYGYHMTYCLAPGDSLHFEIDENCWNRNHKTETSQYALYKTSGTAGQLNNEVAKYKGMWIDSIEMDESIEDSLVRLEPLDYLKSKESEFSHYKAILEQFNTSFNTSPNFQRWASSDLENRLNYELLSYRWRHARRGNEDMSTYYQKMPKAYFNFLNEADLDKSESVISFWYTNFLYDNLMYTYQQIPLDSQNYYNQLDDEKAINTYLFNFFYDNTEGFSTDYAIAGFYYSVLKGKGYGTIKESIDLDLICDSQLRQQVKETYAYEKMLYENPKFGEGVLLKELSENEVLTQLLAEHKGKVLYLDFWAPWCTPCVQEMSYAKKIKEHYANQDVVFVYLASQCKEKDWKASITEHQIKGEHYLLTKNQNKNCSEIFNITGIPHFALIDREGNIVEKDAVRPSNKGQLIKAIDKLLLE